MRHLRYICHRHLTRLSHFLTHPPLGVNPRGSGRGLNAEFCGGWNRSEVAGFDGPQRKDFPLMRTQSAAVTHEEQAINRLGIAAITTMFSLSILCLYIGWAIDS